MEVLVIEPGHGSLWLSSAVFVDRFGAPNPRGRFVRGTSWEYDGGWNMPDDYTGHPVTCTYPRRLVLKVVRPAAGSGGRAVTTDRYLALLALVALLAALPLIAFGLGVRAG